MNRRRPRISECRTMEDLVRAGAAVPVLPTTDTGWRRYGMGRELLPASTNLFRDPQVFNALGTYWLAAPTDCTITPNTAVPLTLGRDMPTKCAKVEFAYDGSARVWESEPMGVTASGHYTLQDMVHVPALGAGGSVAIAAVVYNGASEVRTVALGTVSAVNATFVRYSYPVTVAASGETHVSIRYTFDGADCTTYVTGHKLMGFAAATAVLDSWHDGTLQDCAWTGTANQSTSTRTATSLIYPVTANGIAFIGQSAGTIALRVRTLFSGNDSAGHMIWFMAGTNYMYCQKAANNRITFGGNDGSATTISSGEQSFATDTDHVIICRYQQGAGGTLDLWHDGTTVTQVAYSRTVPVASLDLTRVLTSNQLFMQQTLQFVSIPSRLSDADTAALGTAMQAGMSDMAVFASFCAGRSGALIPLVSDSVGYASTR